MEIKKPEEKGDETEEYDEDRSNTKKEKSKQDNDNGDEDENDNDQENDELIGEEEFDEDDEKATKYVVEEENLDFERFLFRYTHPHALKCYILMLGEYSKNTDFVNRCCMGMFERIAYECKAPQCLYQLSLFALINRIYKDPLARCMMTLTDENQTTNQK